jgi:hypothetical protein
LLGEDGASALKVSERECPNVPREKQPCSVFQDADLEETFSASLVARVNCAGSTILEDGGSRNASSGERQSWPLAALPA